MARENQGVALSTGRLAIGLSAIVGLTGIPGAVGPITIHLISGGTCEIASGPTLSATNTWGKGHLIDQTANPLFYNMIGTVYFLSAGATSVITYCQPLSSGFEV